MRALAMLLGTLLVSTVLVLTAGSPEVFQRSHVRIVERAHSAAVVHPVVETGPVTFAVAGDSITAWLNYSYPAWDGYNDPHSWAGYAIDDSTVMLGGYARSGVGAEGVLANMPALAADVLVIHLATNDYTTDPQVELARFDQIVAASGSEHVVAVAIPPLASAPEFVAPFNAALSVWADAHEYTFVDPYSGNVTDGANWLPGYSDDGIHPNADAAALTGPIIAAAVHHAAGR